MRASIKNYMDALKKRREDEGKDEGGFSLIELIIVVVILGILAAIAIPIFLNIQQDARDNAAQAVAATGATQAAAMLAQDNSVDLSNLETGDATAVVYSNTAGGTIEGICVTVTFTGVDGTTSAGPGCGGGGGGGEEEEEEEE